MINILLEIVTIGNDNLKVTNSHCDRPQRISWETEKIKYTVFYLVVK